MMTDLVGGLQAMQQLCHLDTKLRLDAPLSQAIDSQKGGPFEMPA